MTLPNLATKSDADALGISLPADTADALLKRASARVRRAAGFPISQTITTVQYYSDGCIELPPLTTSVTSVQKDGEAVAYKQQDRWIYTVCGDVAVALTMGYETVPDGIVELVCSIANRLQDEDGAAASGLQMQLVGQTQRMWNQSAATSASDLSASEMKALKRCIPDIKAWMVRVR